MAKYEIFWVDELAAIPGMDASGLGLAVFRDGVCLGLWVAAVSGIVSRVELKESIPLAPCLAVAGAKRIRTMGLAEVRTDGIAGVVRVDVSGSEIAGVELGDEPLPAGPSKQVPVLTYLI